MSRKPVAVLLMALSLLAVFSPVTLHRPAVDEGAVFMTLDVCHAATGLLAAASDVPVVHEAPVTLKPQSVSGRIEVFSSSPYQQLVIIQDERPPKV